MKIATILGTRPNFIKAAPISKAIMECQGVEEVVIHSGQHYSANMDAIFFEQLGLPAPAYRFNANNMSHGAMIGQMVQDITDALVNEKPDSVLVYGDTNTTLAGALAAKVLNIHLAHVEAGLRSYDQTMQEEVNRCLVDKISDILFCPTDIAVKNLEAEGYPVAGMKIVQCGDVMYDAVLMCRPMAIPPKGLENLEKGAFYVATVHRAENTDDSKRLGSIMAALDQLAEEAMVVLPLHPRTKKMLDALGYDYASGRVTIVDPVGYLEMIWLVDNARMLVTDGGGVQKEAYFLETPCVTLRDNSEWGELFDVGANVLSGANTEAILSCVQEMANRQINFGASFYGTGCASGLIVDELLAAAMKRD